MITDNFVYIKWHSRNKNYYLSKGYVFTKMGDEFLVKICDIHKSSDILVNVKCDICGQEKLLRYFVYLHNISSGGYYGCTNKCSMNKYYNTNIKKYGVKYATELDEIKEKRKETCRKRYGVDYAQSLKQFVDKRKNTNMERYGVEYASSSTQFKDKRKKTNLERYGTEYPQNLEKAINKKKQTNLIKYGVEYPHQNKKISEKAQNTMIERYGEIYMKYTPKYNINSILFLDLLSEKLNVPIQHALNGGEKKFVRYYVDGYIEKHNICIEWDEKHHRIKKFINNDLKKDQFLKENFDCNIIRITENDFINDVDNQIIIIINQVNDIIKHGK